MHMVVDVTAWAVATSSLTSSLLRLILGVLAVQAARQALAAGAGGASSPRLRAYRLAVLRALLGSLHDREPHRGSALKAKPTSKASDEPWREEESRGDLNLSEAKEDPGTPSDRARNGHAARWRRAARG